MIDIFAGPGGLSEGFSRYSEWFDDPTIQFRSVLSIEKDEIAVRTLTLRTFYRQFEEDSLPSEYWAVVKGQAPIEVLARFPEWKSSLRHVWQAELGKVPIDQVRDRIEISLKGADDWLLIGGPPCQAYSLMGRARMTGIGFSARNDAGSAEATKQERLRLFHRDERHELYREYLRIIAVHQPTAFVMENVKGILSARLPSVEGSQGFMFDRIRRDLQDPWLSLADDEDITQLAALARPGRPKYRLYALTSESSDLLADEPKSRDFLIKSEDFGVPQKRHRVIVVGVREDHPGLPKNLERVRQATVFEAIGHLPRLRSGISRRGDTEGEWRATRLASSQPLLSAKVSDSVKLVIAQALEDESTILTRGGAFTPERLGDRPETDLEAWLSSPELGGFCQHESRAHMDTDLGRYMYAAASAVVSGKSPKLEQWPPNLLPNHRNVGVSDETGLVEASGFSDRFKVQVWQEPSSTVTSHIAKDGHYFIHPDPAQTRSLTVREAARLQTFPDDYFFCGNRTQQYHQVGNAVPPLLAVHLARSVSVLFASESAPEHVGRHEDVALG